MFQEYPTALIQFRLPTSYVCNVKGIRDLGAETASARALREQSYNGHRPALLFSRNGVTLEYALELATRSGMRVVHGTVQSRTKAGTAFDSRERPYRLLTFVLSRDGDENPDTFRAISRFLEMRWEYLDVKSTINKESKPLLIMMAKTMAERGKSEITIHDEEADAFGIRVTRAQR